MPCLPNEERETNSNFVTPRDGGGEGSSGSVQGCSPAFEQWLNNYRKELDRVRRRERREEGLRNDGVVLPGQSCSG